MREPLFHLIMAASGLAALLIVVLAALRGWSGWLELKRAELMPGRDEGAPASAAARIELADLKERIRKLEAIAAGVDP